MTGDATRAQVGASFRGVGLKANAALAVYDAAGRWLRFDAVHLDAARAPHILLPNVRGRKPWKP